MKVQFASMVQRQPITYDSLLQGARRSGTFISKEADGALI